MEGFACVCGGSCFKIRFMPTEDEKKATIHHVVYEYANLVSSGELLRKQHPYPINTHIQDAFLLNCRKMAEFFPNPSGNPDPAKHKKDVRADDFVSGFTCDLPTWKRWEEQMKKHLAHISYIRVEQKPKEWTGEDNERLLDEFRGAWKELYQQLPDSYRPEFELQIEKKVKCCGFENLELAVSFPSIQRI